MSTALTARTRRIVLRPGGGRTLLGRSDQVVIGVVLATGLAFIGWVAWRVSDPGILAQAGVLVVVFLAVPLGAVALVRWRSQTVLDSRGIHVSGWVSTRHLHWPASRDRIAVVVWPRRHDYAAAAVLLDATGRRTALLGVRGHGPNQVTARAQVDAEVDRIWARAEALGWVRPAAAVASS